MIVTDFIIPETIYKDISYTWKLKYEDVIDYYENTFWIRKGMTKDMRLQKLFNKRVK